MSKFIQRIGTSSTKFAVEIHLTKVEIKLVQKCSVSVTFRRGEHVKETRTEAPLNNGIASFDEKLSFPATLYYVKKKDGYLPKEATLELNIITPTTKRLAGITKFDLAHYANLNMKEQDIILKVGKCFDKDAKFHFRLHMIQLSDVSPSNKKEAPITRKPIGNPNVTDIQDLDIRRSRIQTTPNTINILSNDHSHDTKLFDGLSSVQDLSMIASNKTAPVQNQRRTRSPGLSQFNIIPVHEQFAANRRSKTVDIRSDSEESEDIGTHDPHSQDNLSQTHVEEKEKEKEENKNGNQDLEQKLVELEEQVKVFKTENKTLEERASKGQQDYLNLIQEFQNLKDKYDNMKQNWKNDSISENSLENRDSTQESKDQLIKGLEERIHELSEKVKHLVAANQELEEKNHDLRSRLQEKERKFESLKGPRPEDYEQIISELRKKLEEKDKQLQEKDDKINETQSKLGRIDKRAQEAEANLQEVEHKLSEEGIKWSKELKTKDRRIEDIEYTLKKTQAANEEKMQKIGDLETLVRSYESEIEALKKMNKANASDAEEIKFLKEKVDTLEKKSKSVDESYKKRIDELSKQNAESKREIEQLKGQLHSREIEKENAVTQLTLENDKLKRQVKELNAKILTMQYEGNEAEHLRENIQDLKTRNDTLEAELNKAKMGWAALEAEKENLELALRESEDNNRQRQDRLDITEMELFKLKTKVGELVNTAMEMGDQDLLDRFENIISSETMEMHRLSSKRNQP